MIAAVEAGNLTIVNILLKANPLCANVTAEGVTPLWMASQQGHTKIAKLLIEDCKADVNTKVPDSHRTPLHQAAQGGRTEIVKLLLANGADPDARDSSGVSPLWTAAQKGSAEIVKLLLNLNDAEPLPRPDGATPKVDPNVVTSDGKRTPLHQAAQNGCVDVVRILLERGADPDPRDQHGISPLWSAAQGGFEEIVKMLLATKGADAEVISTSGSNRRPLHQAAQNGHTGVCKLLLAHGVQHEPLDNTNCSPLFFAAQGGHAEIVEILLSKGSSPENAWEKGNKGGRRYCLHQAAQNGHAKVASLLLGAGANVEPDEYIPDEGLLPSSSSDSSDTAEEGPRKVSGYKSRRKYERFLEKKGRTNQQSAPSSPNSNSKRKKRAKSKKRSDRSQYVSVSPLGLAIVAGHIEVVRLLIENGANTNSINNKSQLSPLHLANVAGSEGREDIITLLIENGARVDAKEKDGWTPMMLAAQNGNCNIVDMLIKNGASVDAQGTDGETALWIASQQGHTAIVEKLLQADARSIPTTGSGRYPIHQAAQNGHFEVLKRLVENDPDCVDLSDFNGSTAIAHAAGGKEAIRFHMVEYLISKGAKFISNPGE
ncbi:hypothetical protein DRE_06717 [Drechslerella stenobrocha 248]|uniref:Uncharacterized protein n=1 Tax=Drechslerella stenobrocha 248 TaxID=1043628 RepID=W7I6S2_9PEZI|nr:hypothetical protein DRE_06717 [Drechslerella stenobrocha 248]